MKLDYLLKVTFNQFCCGCKPASEQPEPVQQPVLVQYHHSEPQEQSMTIAQKHLEIIQQDQKENQGNSSFQQPTITPIEIQPKRPVLQLLLLQGPQGVKPQTLIITSKGLTCSLRNAFDGKTFFGSPQEEGKLPVNDFVIDYEDQPGRSYFVIEYFPNDQTYQIKDSGNGSGTFLKIQGELEIKDNVIVSFGDSHMMARHSKDYQNSRILQVTFLEGPKQNEQFTFQPTEGVVTIGRMLDCKIRFEDSNLSRYHCRMEPRDFGWVLIDGDQQRNSTNGTWLFAEDYQQLDDGMMIKAGKYLFKCKLEKP